MCPICEDSGLRLIDRADGNRVAVECVCRINRRALRRIEQARIPQRYAHCSLESYELDFPSAHRSLGTALLQARNFIKTYPLETDGRGLMFVGSIGIGKTHLAVGILNALITERGAKGLFVDYRDLLKQVQNSYNRSVHVTELDVLRPVFEAEILVLDELGASKPTDWVWDTVAHILNTRYNDRRTTIITTNYANQKETSQGQWDNLPQAEGNAKRAVHEETLGDRIGERMRSRLQEMCVIVEMSGKDFRQSVKRANFGSIKNRVPPISDLAASFEDWAGAGHTQTSEANRGVGAISPSKVDEAEPRGAMRLGSFAKRPNVSGTD